jgi:uncharacterized protein YkwD
MGAMISAPKGGFPANAAVLRRTAPRLAICLVAALLTLPLFPAVANAAVSNASSNISKMFQYMNAERAARGLSPLARDSRLDSLAQSWANKMAAERDMYHPNTPQAMTGAGYRSGGQNLAWHDTSLSASWAHNWWMNSGPHRRDILDPAFTHTGLALACNPSGGSRPYVMAVVEFGGNSAPLKSTPPVEPRVAGGDSGAPAGCGGADSPPPPPPAPAPAPAPPPPPAPAPVAPPAAAAKAAAKPSVSPAAKKASPAPSAKAAANKASPTPAGSPSAKAHPSESPAAVPIAAAPASPAAGTTPAASSPARLDPVAVASADSPRSQSGAVVALVAGLSGIVLMFRVSSRRRRVAPKHSISRR